MHAQECWYRQLDLKFNATTREFYNTKGIKLQPRDFGGVTGVDYVARWPTGSGAFVGPYFAPLINALQTIGFVPGKNIRGAPYDWRLGYDPENLYEKMKVLVEQMYAENGGAKVVLLAHSMGNLHVHAFLHSVDQVWKDKYIDSFVAIAAPWSGAPKTVR
jgi:lysophospholipase-3